MFFKILFFISSLSFLYINAYSAEKWNVLMSSWNDLSEKKERNVGLILGKSISSRLEREDDFRIIPGSPSNGQVYTYSNAVLQGREVKADVVIYGTYFIENDRLYVIAEVYDILENRLKMEHVYTGLVTEDIFDTVDSMAADIVEKIKEVLPEMTTENAIKVKKIRETLYETERVNVKRELYTRFGLVTSTGNISFSRYNNNGNMQQTTNTFSGSWPITEMAVGFGFRYWDIRLDLDFTELPGLPVYDWYQNILSTTELQGTSVINVNLSYYLPWWGESLAVGVGVFIQNEITGTNSGGGGNGLFSTQSYFGFPLSFILIWSPIPEIELTLEFAPLFGIVGNNYSQGNGSQLLSYDFPPLELFAVYYFGDFGISGRFSYASGHYYQWSVSDGWKDIAANNVNLNSSSSFQDIYIGIGIVYRVDFLKQ
jgi:TolB-like protein